MALDPRRVKALFNAVLDLPDATQRSAFLDRECGEDRELRQRLDELLVAFDQPAVALEAPFAPNPPDEMAARAELSPPLGPTAAYVPNPTPASLIGSVIAGRYKIREEIGEGGMGTVFLAEQTQPVKRKVALKLIKAGMDSRTVLARFESERQALALMDHPNIAKVLDAGSTESGHPFFVMELVKGIPVNDYCDAHRLGLPERLALFRQICSAVQHAHQKGIIHRDLKPSNLLVESHDGKPVPKVIDFGLAKATSGMQLTEHSLYSAFGSVAGTPLYMAPEQASFNAIDVDTRADIYALGVILYELLTGSTPIQRETFKRAALDEMLRVIREVEPPTPSNRISTSEALPNIAASRHIEPARLSRFVRGDLDWIVMKSLAKERQRRYDSAIGLANDLERFLNHEPVSAGPPSAMYRIRKFVRRNRMQVVAGSLVLLALVGGLLGTALGLVEARKQRLQAEKRLAQNKRTNEILGAVFRALNPEKEEGENKPVPVLLGESLDHAAAEIEGEAIGDALDVAEMQTTLGKAQLGLGFPEKAAVLLAKARDAFHTQLGPNHPNTLMANNSLAVCYSDASQFDRVLPLLEETLSLAKTQLGLDHATTLTIMNNLANAYRAAGNLERALPILEECLVLTKAKFGNQKRDTLICMNNLALGYGHAGHNDRALPILEACLPLMKANLGADHPTTLTCMNNLAGGYETAGNLQRALEVYEEAFTRRKAIFANDHPGTLALMANLASAYVRAEKFDRALSLDEDAFTLSKARLGPDDPVTLVCMDNLARDYGIAGKSDKALALYEASLALAKARFGVNSNSTITPMNNLASQYYRARMFDRALPLFEQTLQLLRSARGREHPDTISCMSSLALTYENTGRRDEAIPILRELVELHRTREGAGSLRYAWSLVLLGDVLLRQKEWNQADPVLREGLEIREAKEPDDWRTFNTKSLLGGALLGQKKYGEAEPALKSGYEGLKQRLEKIPPEAKDRLGEALDRLIELAEAMNKPDEAKRWKDEKAKITAPEVKKP